MEYVDKPRCRECDEAGQDYTAVLLRTVPTPPAAGGQERRQTWRCTNGHCFEVGIYVRTEPPLERGQRRTLSGQVRPITNPFHPGYEPDRDARSGVV